MAPPPVLKRYPRRCDGGIHVLELTLGHLHEDATVPRRDIREPPPRSGRDVRAVDVGLPRKVKHLQSGEVLLDRHGACHLRPPAELRAIIMRPGSRPRRRALV